MDVLMPQLGETVSEGTIADWHKQPGDSVEKGDLLLDVETDKVATEITAPVSGTLAAIKVAQGETVDVGTVLAVIAAEGEEVEAPAEAPSAVEEAAPAESAPVAKATQGLPSRKSREKLSPAVRRLLKEHDLDVSLINGTGREGRVTRKDVVAFIESGAASSPKPAPAPSAPAPGSGSPEMGTRVPFNRVRRVTAAHMVKSKATSPHVLQTIDVDFHAVDVARLARKNLWKSEKGYSLTYLPFVARAVCEAIQQYPRVNASVEDDALLIHANINLSIAIDLGHEGTYNSKQSLKPHDKQRKILLHSSTKCTTLKQGIPCENSRPPLQKQGKKTCIRQGFFFNIFIDTSFNSVSCLSTEIRKVNKIVAKHKV